MLAPMNLRILALLALVGCAGAVAAEAPKLTAYERSQGWKLLFDGRDTSDWRAFGGNKLPANWQVRDGSLAGAAGGAIASAEEFGDFELQFDWRVAPGGRGAVHIRADEEAATPEASGPVMLLAGHGDALGGNGLRAPDRAIPPQFDVWYRAKIVVFGNQVEYFINGDRVASYMLDTAEWRAAVAASPQAGVKNFGRLRAGRIVFTGEGVELRNVKVRNL